MVAGKEIFSADDGYFEFYSLEKLDFLEVSAKDHRSARVDIASRKADEQVEIVLERQNKNWILKLIYFILQSDK